VVWGAWGLRPAGEAEPAPEPEPEHHHEPAYSMA
jgi:hypothetical protein